MRERRYRERERGDRRDRMTETQREKGSKRERGGGAREREDTEREREETESQREKGSKRERGGASWLAVGTPQEVPITMETSNVSGLMHLLLRLSE